MVQQASISLADAAGSPVTHVFSTNGSSSVPLGRDTIQRAEYVDRSAASAIGNWTIKLDYKQRASDGAWKLVSHLRMPILENVSNSTISGIAPAPTVAYTVEAKTEYTLPQRCTVFDRQSVRKMNYNLQNHAQLVALVESPERVTS